VLLQPGGQRIMVAAGQSVVDAALAAGINLPHSCKGGSCGSCRARLLSGSVSYPLGRPMGLAPAEEAAGAVLLCSARPDSDLVVEVRMPRPAGAGGVKRLPCRVQQMRRVSPDVMALHLRLPAVESFDFLPGQYVDLLLEDGRRRSFSIASAPGHGAALELHVRRVSGGEFTRQVFEEMRVGTVLRLEGPMGMFYLHRERSRPWLMVAGGTGLAPIQSMLRWAEEAGETRAIRLFWGVRQEADLYARGELDRLSAALQDFRWWPVLSETGDAAWPGSRGPVHRAVLADQPALARFDVYLAGPPAMVQAARAEFAAAGAEPDAIFFDSFEFAPDTLRAMSAAGQPRPGDLPPGD